MSEAIQVDHRIGGKPRSDAVIAVLARDQHGVLSRAQLLERGVGRRVIDRAVSGRRLHPLHRGVYAVGHPRPSREGRWMAAVLAGGPGAVLSHQSAAALWGIRPDSRPVEDVTVCGGRVGRPGIRFHRVALPADEQAGVDGIPVTSLSRTLLDLGAVTNDRQVERAINTAEVRRLFDAVSLRALATRHPHHPGTSAARRALERRAEGASITRSDFEEWFIEAIRRASLPSPEVNATLVVGGRTFESDFLWREHRVIVELDGYEAHGTRRAFEDDRERDRILQAAGWRPIRVTWRQRHRVGGDLRALLGTVWACAR